jgi:hypothetical protein
MTMSDRPRRYAEGTSVDVATSRADVERLVTRHGATSFASVWQADRFAVIFEMRGRRLRFDVPAPDAKKYRDTKKWEAENRRRWRALLLILKAKLELIASGDVDFEAEFLSQIVLPDGGTVGARLLPELDRVLSGRPMPPLLPGGSP